MQTVVSDCSSPRPDGAHGPPGPPESEANRDRLHGPIAWIDSGPGRTAPLDVVLPLPVCTDCPEASCKVKVRPVRLRSAPGQREHPPVRTVLHSCAGSWCRFAVRSVALLRFLDPPGADRARSERCACHPARADAASVPDARPPPRGPGASRAGDPISNAVGACNGEGAMHIPTPDQGLRAAHRTWLPARDHRSRPVASRTPRGSIVVPTQDAMNKRVGDLEDARAQGRSSHAGRDCARAPVMGRPCARVRTAAGSR